ncbi:MAG TPA: ComF family protein [Dehalococcoidia bacterium]|nr:ComF family protein [Dehalococcoidia bacterium]
MLPQLTRFKGIALDLLFPRWCVGCGKEGDFICPSCRKSLPRIKPPLCPRCGQPQGSDSLCPNCADWQAEIDGIRAPFRFEGTMRQAILELKYRNLRALAGFLARLLYDYLSTSPLPGDVLVPVPLHRKRLRERGYNQSRLLAKELSKLSTLPLVDDCLIRQRHSSPQARTPTVDQRRSNVANAFACRDRRLKDKQVLLIDDVSTSGATLDACARALKASGAASVWGLALAKEV